MKIKLSFLIILILLCLNSYAQDNEKLKELKKNILKEESELENLQKRRTNTIKQLSLISSQIEDYKRFVMDINKEIEINTKYLNTIKEEITQTNIKIKKIKNDIIKSNIYVIDNLKYSYIMIISTATNSENLLKILEIITKANAKLDTKIQELNINTQKKETLIHNRSQKINELEDFKKSKQEALNMLRLKNKKYTNTLTILKQTAAGRKEYIDFLKFQLKQLDDELNKASTFNISSNHNKSDLNFVKMQGRMGWPVHGKITEPYGNVYMKDAGINFFRKGINIRPNRSGNILCVAPGTVIFADYIKGFDDIVVIKHSKSYYTVYGHMTKLNVKAGDHVNAGNPIGILELDINNNLGLYFEIRKNKVALNPLLWLSGNKRR